MSAASNRLELIQRTVALLDDLPSWEIQRREHYIQVTHSSGVRLGFLFDGRTVFLPDFLRREQFWWWEWRRIQFAVSRLCLRLMDESTETPGLGPGQP